MYGAGVGDVDGWRSGNLRVYVRWPDGLREVPELAGWYVAVGAGLALPDDRYSAAVDNPAELRGVRADFSLRDGRLVCSRIVSPAGHGGLSAALLRRLGPALAGLAREIFERHAVRLREHDGDVVGEPSWCLPDGSFGDDPGVAEEARRSAGPGRGRPPLSDEHLEAVARLYREAAALGVPRAAYVGRRIPGYSPETIRNWVRQARRRGLLEPAR